MFLKTFIKKHFYIYASDKEVTKIFDITRNHYRWQIINAIATFGW